MNYKEKKKNLKKMKETKFNAEKKEIEEIKKKINELFKIELSKNYQIKNPLKVT